MSEKKEPMRQLPKGIRTILTEAAGLGLFTARFLSNIFRRPFELRELIRQSYEIGNKSLSLVGTTAFIMGLVLTIQSRPTLMEFGAEAMLPSMVAVSIIREIGPVITALICAGKVGSGIGAEIGSMKVTEQIDAMEVSGVNPFKYLAVTRILAATFMLPLLVIIADAIALWGSYIGVNIKGNISLQLFFNHVFETLSYSDILPSIAKSFAFGLCIGIISCYKGFTSNKGTEGVGKAANSAVVMSSLSIFIIDLLAAQITDILFA
jgi:phospholipid/cholesterol/gamma-HCH transport system permease protein